MVWARSGWGARLGIAFLGVCGRVLGGDVGWGGAPNRSPLPPTAIHLPCAAMRFDPWSRVEIMEGYCVLAIE